MGAKKLQIRTGDQIEEEKNHKKTSPWQQIGPMEQTFSGAPYLVQKDQGHLTTSVFLPQGHRTRYKIIRGILDPDHPPKFGPWP